jgi:hypothetical protein
MDHDGRYFLPDNVGIIPESDSMTRWRNGRYDVDEHNDAANPELFSLGHFDSMMAQANQDGKDDKRPRSEYAVDVEQSDEVPEVRKKRRKQVQQNNVDGENVRLEEKSRRITKRQAAKERNYAMTAMDVRSDFADLNLIDPVQFEMAKYANLDEKSRKKMQQMIRNRISAQSHRDKKKAYITDLEHASQQLRRQNEMQSMRIRDLEREIEIMKAKVDGIAAVKASMGSMNVIVYRPLISANASDVESGESTAWRFAGD